MGTVSRTSLAVIATITVAFILTAIVQVINGSVSGLLEISTSIGGSIVAGVILILALRSSHFGELRVASWFVTIGAVVVAMEHVMWPN